MATEFTVCDGNAEHYGEGEDGTTRSLKRTAKQRGRRDTAVFLMGDFCRQVILVWVTLRWRGWQSKVVGEVTSVRSRCCPQALPGSSAGLELGPGLE